LEAGNVWTGRSKKIKKIKTRENCLNSCRNVSVLCDDYGDVSFFFCFLWGGLPDASNSRRQVSFFSSFLRKNKRIKEK
jgi:hypothetical protein